jgi:DNA polymerase III sliding clamp (beta) subunit (PCNA family)
VNILATELKHQLKKLSPVKTEQFIIGPHGVSAQDSDVWAVVESPLSGLGDPFSLNGKKFSQVLNRMSGQVTVDREDKKITIRSAKAKVDLEIANVKSQTIPDPPEKTMSFSCKEFKSAVSTAVSSASTNKSADFGGVIQVRTLPLGLEEESPSGYQVIGTDGNVLTVVLEMAAEPYETKFLLNFTAASVVQSLDEDIIFGETNTSLQFQSGGVRVFASKPNQTYPEFGKLLKEEPKILLSLKPGEWVSALHTIEPLIDTEIDSGGVTGKFKEGTVTWTAGGIGSLASDEATYEQISPDPIFDPKEFTLRINEKYLSGFLSKAGDSAILKLTDTNKPVQMESGNITVLVMLMKGSK